MRNRRDTRSSGGVGRFLHGVGFDGLDDLLADAVHRVQGVHRRLEHHGHPPPAKMAHLILRQQQQILSFQNDLSRREPAVVGQQAHQAVGDGRLAAARLAHQPQRLPAPQLETDRLHGVHRPLPRRVG